MWRSPLSSGPTTRPVSPSFDPSGTNCNRTSRSRLLPLPDAVRNIYGDEDMPSKSFQGRFAGVSALVACALLVLASVRHGQPTTAQEPRADGHGQKYDAVVRPLVKKYCLDCHSTKAKKGSLDL